MTADCRRRIAWWAAGAVAACAAIPLRDVASAWFGARVDPQMYLTTLADEVVWAFCFYLSWAALVPLIFVLGRRVPFTRGRWAFPLAFHLVACLVVVACSTVVLGNVVDIAYFHSDFPELSTLASPLWTNLIAYRTVNDGWMYWAILVAGFALRAHDEDQARRRDAADLERSLVAAQVEALKMKLQPHFLFNTLNSISFLAVEKDTEGLVTMIGRLSALLRSSMQSDGSQLVALGHELALLDQYLAIEEIRFADRLRVVRRIDPAAMHALVPSLVLQPIVENSIKHGFSRRIDAHCLEIAIRREHDSLVVVVEDDGPGIAPGWELATQCGRGLKNVIERIDKLYPGAWALTLKNRPGGGATARLRIPWHEAGAAALGQERQPEERDLST